MHHLLEEGLAKFLGADAALTLVSGYLANVTTIAHLLGSRDALFIDELSHNSIVSGAKSAVAETIVFRHNDLDHLAFLLSERRDSYRNVLIVVESLYSMDGDVADLNRLVEIKEAHNAWLLIDEAHSLGVLGDEGRGLCEYCGVDPQRVDLMIGTLSKALASCGGFIAGKAAVIEWLRYTLPGFVYSRRAVAGHFRRRGRRPAVDAGGDLAAANGCAATPNYLCVWRARPGSTPGRRSGAASCRSFSPTASRRWTRRGI